MGLKNILDLAVRDQGWNLNDSAERAAVLTKINAAALFIYQSTDLPGCMAQEVFNVAVDSSLIVLPPRVYEPRRARYVENRYQIDLDHGGNRYAFPGPQDWAWDYRWRRVGTSPLYTELENQSTLTFRLPVALSTAVSINVQGPTDRAQQARETVTIPAGSLEVSTAENFKAPVRSITKDIITPYDITIEDADGNEIGLIPNNQLFCRNVVWQVKEDSDVTLNTYSSSIEVWYKKAFAPFKDNEDQFLDTDDYDMAIYQKFLSYESKNAQDVVNLQMLSNKELNNTLDDKEIATQRTKFSVRPTVFFNMPYKYLRS